MENTMQIIPWYDIQTGRMSSADVIACTTCGTDHLIVEPSDAASSCPIVTRTQALVLWAQRAAR